MSFRDYYEVLGLQRNCNNENISESYRRLALKYNPKRNNPKEYALNNVNFHQVAEAYQILNNRKYFSLMNY